MILKVTRMYFPLSLALHFSQRLYRQLYIKIKIDNLDNLFFFTFIQPYGRYIITDTSAKAILPSRLFFPDPKPNQIACIYIK